MKIYLLLLIEAYSLDLAGFKSVEQNLHQNKHDCKGSQSSENCNRVWSPAHFFVV